MSELALRLIAENKKTRATFLDLGNCGLTEVPDEIGELVWLEGLSFASHWWDDEEQYNTQNSAAANNITILCSDFYQLKNLKKLWLNCDHYNKKFDLVDLNPLVGLSSLQMLSIAKTQVSNLSPLASLSNLQKLDVSYTPVSSTQLSKYIR